MSADLLQILVVPTCFVLAGLLGLRLGTPRSIAFGLLGVGCCHLLAFGASVAALATSGPAAGAVNALSQMLFAGGFAALVWIAGVFPLGGRPARSAIAAGVLAVAGPAVGALSAATPTVLEADLEQRGPVLPLLPDGAVVLAATPLLVLPVLAVGIFLRRYTRADLATRQMMRWPGVGVAVVATAVLTGILLGPLFPAAGGVVFLLAAPALPLGLAFGPVRHRLHVLTDQTSQLSADLAARVAELEESRHRLSMAAEDERRRIERDLHDGAQQELLALIAQVEIARASEDTTGRDRALARAAELGRGAYETVRRVSHGIRPAVLDDLGLAAAVRAAADLLPVRVRLHITADHGRRHSPEVEGAALFFVSESLANVLKHAEASSVTIRLADEDGLRVSVEDDGRGGLDHDGAGIRGIRDRLEGAGGSLGTSSRPGRTLLTAEFPEDRRG